MRLTLIVEKGADGSYSVYPENATDLIVGEGKTAKEAIKDYHNTRMEVIQDYLESGDEMPDDLKIEDFEYRYDISALFNYFNYINVSKFARAIGIEPSLMRHYKAGDTYISQEQAKKIEAGIHELATELMGVSL